MNNPDLITRAVTVHFAIENRHTLQCDTKLEFYVSIAKDFLTYFLTGTETEGFSKAMKTARYRTKKLLIERYIRNHESK